MSKKLMLGVMGLAASAAMGQPIFSTGFEPVGMSSYMLGELNGQNGWMVTPRNAEAYVENGVVFTGRQAVEVIDGASFGRAQLNISTSEIGPVLESSFAMFASRVWSTIPDEVLDRFEAQQRLEFTDADGMSWGLEFGLMTTSIGYDAIEPGQTAFYIELTNGDLVQASSFALVDASTAYGAWHMYTMRVDVERAQAALLVDGEPTVFLTWDTPLVALSVLQLQNQRWGTNPMNSESLYFDDLDVLATTCAADVNGDGNLNIFDFVAFQNLWTRQNPLADCNGDGRFNVLDFVCYQALFQGGCI
jgi:hypothetical protein